MSRIPILHSCELHNNSSCLEFVGTSDLELPIRNCNYSGGPIMAKNDTAPFDVKAFVVKHGGGRRLCRRLMKSAMNSAEF